MFRMVPQARGGACVATSLARTFTRSVHNVKLVGLHDQLFQPAPEILRLHCLRLHGLPVEVVKNAGYIEPARTIVSETTRHSNSTKTCKNIKTSTIVVASATALITESPAETSLLSKATFGEFITALGDAIESLTWIHSGRPNKNTKFPQDTKTTIDRNEEVL